MSSQGWEKDAFLDVRTGKPVATEEDQEHQNYPEDSVSTGKPVAPGYPGNSGNPQDSGTEGNGEDWPHHLHISPNCVQHIEKVFLQRYGRSRTDKMNDLDVSTAIWGIFLSVTLQAVVHLGKDYTQKLRSTMNQPKKSLRQLFQVTERLITDQTENYWTDSRLTGSNLDGERRLC